jgi:hypothetical protein
VAIITVAKQKVRRSNKRVSFPIAKDCDGSSIDLRQRLTVAIITDAKKNAVNQFSSSIARVLSCCCDYDCCQPESTSIGYDKELDRFEKASCCCDCCPPECTTIVTVANQKVTCCGRFEKASLLLRLLPTRM